MNLTPEERTRLENRKEAARVKLKTIYPIYCSLKEELLKWESLYTKNYVRFIEADEALSYDKIGEYKVLQLRRKKEREEKKFDEIINTLDTEGICKLIQKLEDKKGGE